MGSVLLQCLLTLCLLVNSIRCQPCLRVESLDISSGFSTSNGSIVHDNIEYSSEEWYEAEEDGVQKRFGCPCIKRICLWKCCSDGEAFLDGSCNNTDISDVNPFNPPIFKGQEQLTLAAQEHFFFMYNKLCLSNRYLVDPSLSPEELYMQQMTWNPGQGDMLRDFLDILNESDSGEGEEMEEVMEAEEEYDEHLTDINGTLYEIAMGRPQWHAPARFCLDVRVTDLPARIVAAVCFPDEETSTDDSDGLYIAYGVGLLLSVPFLMATFLVYAFIPELRNLHGMCLMAYCGGLIVAYPFLAYLKLNTGEVGVAMSGCLAIAFIVYYAFQTSFFWLNVMCFDIWRTFSGYRGGSNYKRRETKRFALYGAYAWGIPLALTACTAAMQFSNNLPSHIIRPSFGERRCWFEDWHGEMVYFFTPVLILVVCNVVLFLITANRIRSIRQETAILKGSESARSDKLKRDKQRYALYLKLFVVMGVNWTVELISFVVGGSNWYWVLIDLSNIALGFFIFIIFVWKNKVRNLIHKRVRSLRGVTAATDSGLGRWATRSSSAPTEDTRVSADETGIRLREHH